ncbi:MAG: cyanophycin synthetase [Microthrixaceae bacterium]
MVVDYAHTPDALENVLGAAGELLGPGGRLVVVFGCGGDRDRGRRPLMGEWPPAPQTGWWSPRTTPLGGSDGDHRAGPPAGCDDSVVVEPDRRTAIRVALSGRGPADVVVIAGKGHETGQDFGDRVEPFDDRVVASEELRERGGGR